MTLHTRQFTVPAQTAKVDAVTKEIEVDQLVLKEASVFIDPGSNGEVNVEVLFGDSLLLPAADGDPISKPLETGPVPVNRELPGVPNTVTIRAWAPDADFEHEVIAQIVMVSPEEVTETVKISEFGEDAQATAQRLSGGPQNLTPADDE
jgi:hypothetical protein